MHDVCPRSFYDGAKLGNFLPYTDYSVIRANVHKQRSPDWADSMLYDIENDYTQTQNLAGTPLEIEYAAKLVETMQAMDAPEEQFERLGLEKP